MTSDAWRLAGLPRARAAALAALHLREPSLAVARDLDDRGWTDLLRFCDEAGLTLIVTERLRRIMPEWVAARTGRDLERNRERLRRLNELQGAIASRLDESAIPFAVLKGVTQSALSGLPGSSRAQYDIDILTAPDDSHRATAALATLGFEPFTALERFPTDHLPPMIRKTGWEFRGDYFDPEIPASVEVHFQLWSEQWSFLPAPGIDAFWTRRIRRETDAGSLPALAPADAIGYAGLHVLKHLLQGSVRPFHVYELAAMLQRNCGDEDLWNAWIEWHDPALRALETLGFQLAERWFGCPLPPEAEADWRRAPVRIQAWFREFALAPAAASASKAELWLHCAMLRTTRQRLAVARRRLVPLHLPAPIDGVYLEPKTLTWRRRALRLVRQAKFTAERARIHAVAAARVAASGARWWRNARLPH